MGQAKESNAMPGLSRHLLFFIITQWCWFPLRWLPGSQPSILCTGPYPGWGLFMLCLGHPWVHEKYLVAPKLHQGMKNSWRLYRSHFYFQAMTKFISRTILGVTSYTDVLGTPWNCQSTCATAMASLGSSYLVGSGSLLALRSHTHLWISFLPHPTWRKDTPLSSVPHFINSSFIQAGED